MVLPSEDGVSSLQAVPAKLILDQLSHPAFDRKRLSRLKNQVAKQTQTQPLTNAELLAQWRMDVDSGKRQANAQVISLLTTNRVRSASGIATVTVLTKPYACPGRCVYCPTSSKAPKSYLPQEPPVQRALQNDYDPFGQVTERLQALYNTGHPTDKIELIIKGGTWSYYPPEYQEAFIKGCFDAANAFGVERKDAETLEQAHAQNETAQSRIIGLTVETRPDYVTAAEVVRLRQLGVTRVELGVQSLEEEVLALTVRDHGVEEVRTAMRLLKDAGFKICVHMMPNLPGANLERDEKSLKTLFQDPDFRPDTLKIYPCVVLESAEISEWLQSGQYKPYPDETLMTLLAEFKSHVPAYVRIERVVRDIDATIAQAGCQQNNFREQVQERLRLEGKRCRCVRCREVGEQSDGHFALRRRDYEASQGQEIFLSFEDEADRVSALLRLRIPGQTCELLEGLEKVAFIRELHTYGWHQPLEGACEDAVQHKGFGKQLMAEAEHIAKASFGCDQMVVISGVGVRGYYQRLGYVQKNTYMVKSLV